MNRYKLNEPKTYPDRGIYKGQIYRGWLCSCNPMLIRIDSSLGSDLWLVQSLHEDQKYMQMQGSHIIKAYAIDEHGGI